MSFAVFQLMIRKQTAFHASFASLDDADHKTIQISRGTSVVSISYHVSCVYHSLLLDSSTRVHPVSALPIEIARLLVHQHAARKDR